MTLSRVWHRLRGKAHIVFPCIACLLTTLILTSPFMSGPLAFMHEMAFVRFCMFWCLGGCFVLTTVGRSIHPSAASMVATVFATVIALAFYAVYREVLGFSGSAAPFFFSCLSGSILGALAGTWFIFALEMYIGNRR